MKRKMYCCDASKQLYEDYYGRNVLPVYVGRHYQRKHELTFTISGLFRRCFIPFIALHTKQIGRQILDNIADRQRCGRTKHERGVQKSRPEQYKNDSWRHAVVSDNTHAQHNRFTALWNLSGTTRVSWYQKKHSPLTLIVVINHSYLLPPSTMIHGILPIQPTCFTVFFHNLSPSFLWSTCWPGTHHFILHTFLHPIIVFFSQHMPIPSQPVLP